MRQHELPDMPFDFLFVPEEQVPPLFQLEQRALRNSVRNHPSTFNRRRGVVGRMQDQGGAPDAREPIGRLRSP